MNSSLYIHSQYTLHPFRSVNRFEMWQYKFYLKQQTSHEERWWVSRTYGLKNVVFRDL